MLTDNTRHEYCNFKENFYEQHMKKANFISRYILKARTEMIYKEIKGIYKKGMRILDIGCGNVLWNKDKLPVIGIDLNKKFLEYSKKQGRLSEYICMDVTTQPIELKEKVDIVIISELIEHLGNYNLMLSFLHDIINKDGYLIVTVPYDTIFSLWKPLFALQCFYMGYYKGRLYYKKGCGHINHFSPKTIKRVIELNHYFVEKQFTNYRFSIFTVARKKWRLWGEC